MRYKLRVGVDVDGVVADLFSVWIRRLNERFGVKIDYDDTSQYDFWVPYGLTRAQGLSVLSPDIYIDVKPFPDALGAIDKLRDAGHEVVFVTKIEDPTGDGFNAQAQAKYDWLARHGFLGEKMPEPGLYADNHHYVAVEGSKRDVDVDVLIDDSYDNVREFHDHRTARGRFGVLITRPYNKTLITDLLRRRNLMEAAMALAQYQGPLGTPVELNPLSPEGLEAQRQINRANSAIVTGITAHYDAPRVMTDEEIDSALAFVNSLAACSVERRHSIGTARPFHEALLDAAVPPSLREPLIRHPDIRLVKEMEMPLSNDEMTTVSLDRAAAEILFEVREALGVPENVDIREYARELVAKTVNEPPGRYEDAARFFGPSERMDPTAEPKMSPIRLVTEMEFAPSSLPTDWQERKDTPLMTGVLDYFPAALAEVARVSKAGNDQHNPGQPLHWARGKSADHADSAVRHLIDRGKFDADGQRHSAKAAWRALANLQEELEAEGAPPGRASRFPEVAA